MSGAGAAGVAGILEIRLETDPATCEAQRDFYARALGLPVADEPGGGMAVAAGATRLVFVPAATGRPAYHFAFNIPENQLASAKEWMAARTPILRGEEGEVFHFESWDADAFYFHDPAGNLGELIARHDLPNARPGEFAADGFLCASEIGFVVDDVPATVRDLETSLGLSVYRPGSAQFAPVGDEHGLLILTRRGRDWWSDTPSLPYPVDVRLRGDGRIEHRVPGYPYVVRR